MDRVDTSYVYDIFTKNIVIYENIKGNTIYVKFDGEDFFIKTEIYGELINISDESIINFYGKAINYLYSLNDRIKSIIPKNWWFEFEFFNEPNNNYTKQPKNNLVLCSILRSNKRYYEIDQLEEFSRLFDVECLPFIFKGKLSDNNIDIIIRYLNTSKEDLEYIFGETSFAYFFYKLLNPQLSNSFLSNNFESNIKSLIIKTDDGIHTFEILNPLYDIISSENITQFAEVYSLIMISFLTFIQSINLYNLEVKGSNRNYLYTELMCILYNAYIDDVGDDIKKFNFIIPEFYDNKFSINNIKLENKKTIETINSNEKFEYVFKCIYFSFRKPKDKPIGVLNDNMLNIFNIFIEKINTFIDELIDKKNEIELRKKGLIDFGDFFDIKYDTDSQDNVYPDIYDEIKRGSVNKKKKYPIKK